MIGVDSIKACLMDAIVIGPYGEECGLKERQHGLYLYQGSMALLGGINEP